VAALGIVSVLALGALFGGAVVYEHRLRGARDLAEANREQAVANYRQARKAINKALARASSPGRADLPRLRELRREQQEEALAFFLAVANQEGQTPEVRFDVAQSRQQAGRMQIELGRPAEAKENLRRALDLAAALAAELPQEARYRALQAQCQVALGSLYGKGDEALRCLEQALVLAEALVQEDPASEDHRMALVDALNQVGYLYHTRGNVPEAVPPFRRAEALAAELLRQQPSNRERRCRLAEMRINLSLMYQLSSQPEEMRRYHDLAEETLAGLVRDDPHDYDTTLSLGQLRVNWAYVLAAEGKPEEAAAGLTAILPRLEEAHRQEPSLEAGRERLIQCFGVRAELLEKQKRYREAVDDHKRIVELVPSGNGRDFRRMFLALAYARAGQHAFAAQEAQGLDAPTPLVAPADQFLHLALVYSVATGAARDDRQLPETERDKRARQYAEKALAMLRSALAAVDDARWTKMIQELRTDKDFDPLRDPADFQKLIQE
jgi:tetratricopeptide (TPR) repeat protein